MNLSLAYKVYCIAKHDPVLVRARRVAHFIALKRLKDFIRRGKLFLAHGGNWHSETVMAFCVIGMMSPTPENP